MKTNIKMEKQGKEMDRWMAANHHDLGRCMRDFGYSLSVHPAKTLVQPGTWYPGVHRENKRAIKEKEKTPPLPSRERYGYYFSP